MFERLRKKDPFRIVVYAAKDTAWQRGRKRIGTDDLFLGLLTLPEIARTVGVDQAEARAALDALEAEALAAIGLELGADELLAPAVPVGRPPGPLSTSLTSGSRSTVTAAVSATTTKTRDRVPEHLLLTLLDRRPPDPAALLLTKLGCDRYAVRAAVEESLDRRVQER